MVTKYSKKLLILLVSLSIFYGFSFFIQSENSDTKKRYYSSGSFKGGFSVALDKNTQVSGKSVFDFDVYHFFINDKVVLNAYLGWHPSFPIRTTLEKKEITFNIDGWIGGYETKCFTWQDKQYALECLVDFDTGLKSPQFVHYWGYYENPDDRSNALNIVKSTKKWLRKEKKL